MAWGSVSEVFLYDPYAAPGSKFTVLQSTPILRLYHSTALLVPDGRTLVMGHDAATYNILTSYDHRAEAFTPPWLQPAALARTPRPVIMEVPTGRITFNGVFTVTYRGTVTRVSIMAPGSATHTVEMTARTLLPIIESKTATSIQIRAPKNKYVILPGYYMIFLLNGDTPSIAKWIRFADIIDINAPTTAPIDMGDYCRLGVLNYEGTLCCAASCGTCGGVGCGDKPGGESLCCTGSITAPCIDKDDVGCVVPESAPVTDPVVAPSAVPIAAPSAAPIAAPVAAPCSGPFTGYPECEKKVTWNIDNRPSTWYAMRGLDATRCSLQEYFSLAANGAYCPNPYFY